MLDTFQFGQHVKFSVDFFHRNFLTLGSDKLNFISGFFDNRWITSTEFEIFKNIDDVILVQNIFRLSSKLEILIMISLDFFDLALLVLDFIPFTLLEIFTLWYDFLLNFHIQIFSPDSNQFKFFRSGIVLIVVNNRCYETLGLTNIHLGHKLFLLKSPINSHISQSSLINLLLVARKYSFDPQFEESQSLFEGNV